MKEQLLEIIKNKNYTPKTIDELYDLVETKDLILLKNTLDSLIDEGYLYQKKDKYYSSEKAGIYRGIISIKEKGYGFITSESFEEDFFVSENSLYDSFNKDEVLFKIDSKKGNKKEAYVIRTIKRATKVYVGEVYFFHGAMYLDAFDKTFNGTIKLVSSKVDAGDFVKAEVESYNERTIKAKVLCVMGNKDEIGSDILSIAMKYDFNSVFPDEVLKEADKLYNDEEKRPFIDKTIITIDGDDALDLDDAISVEKKENGNYLLGVYIADVSHYVKKNTSLDKEAYHRGTSVYLTDRVIPMLPKKLSNDLCSLNSGTKKLVLYCMMEINQKGEVVSSEIKEGSIKTKYRMTYNNVNKMLNGDEKTIAIYEDIYEMVLTAKELRDILRNMRMKRGSLDFDVPEGKVIVDEEGRAFDIVLRERGISETIIEEFMLIANETVATTIYSLELPFLYRVHDKPNKKKIKEFSTIINSILKDKQSSKKMNPSRIHQILEELKDNNAIKNLLLRVMAKAVYSNNNIGHYGLASTCYTHFTSPIRRYPDLIVHRLLRKYLINNDINADEFESLENALYEIGVQTSKKERDAMECEYEVDDMKKAEYMEHFIGSEYEGYITGIQKFGIFVSLENTVEGLVKSDTFYEYKYSEKTLSCVVHQNFKTIEYHLGDKVRVKLMKVNKKRSEIDFKIVYNKDSKKVDKNGDKRNYHKKQKSKS